MIELIEKNVEEKEDEQNLLNKLLNKQSLVEESSIDEKFNDVLTIILKRKKIENEIDFSSIEMCGKKCIDYVLNACQHFETKIVEYESEFLNNDELFKVIKENLNNKKYVLVLFATTPLLTKNTVNDIVEYFFMKKLSCLEFNRGFMFETDYLKKTDKIYNPHKQNFFEEDFLSANNVTEFYVALMHLKMRINQFHLKSGVIFLDMKSASIDADVSIEKNVIIGENVKICGKSVILENAKIFSSKLNKVIVKPNAIIENSIVENSVILENAEVLDFSVIKNQTINKNEKIENEKRI